MDRRIPVLLGGALLLASMIPAPVAAKSAPRDAFTEDGNFVVQLADAPVVAYSGSVKGLRATAPKAGAKIDPLSSDVVAYVGYLNGKHASVLSAAGGRKLYDYVYSYNGFAAKLTAAQANKIASLDGVVAVSPEETYTVDTSSTPSFLGLDQPGGLWDQTGGISGAGDGVIVGIIDSGIWPESLSFTDRTGLNGNASQDGKLDYQQIPGWHGKCTPGEGFVASNCNQKLIGAQWFDESWGGDKGVEAQRPWEFTSARDYNGHGTHTSSTAAGNNKTPTTGAAAAFGTVSGIAPHARVAMYKALWSTQAADTASGNTSDLVAAIDQAVADGVDVINYSISGTLTNYRDPVEISFLYAAQAGIFVAESAGNSGPTTSTVAHPAPWTTTVAAGTHNRDGQGSVTLGDGTTINGASVATAVTAPLIDAEAAGLPGADATAVRLCFAADDTGGTPVLDPAKVAGKIVVCDRGTNARTNKSLAVQQAGGVGMILLNTSANSLNADFHYVPTVHLQNTARVTVKTYAATPGATATINKATIVTNAPAPFTATFSSRGPSLASLDLLKPDLIAPGQDILAAVSPAGNHGMDFNLYSGTSMSSPHVAGLAALLKDLHPTWTPMMIKSALMTTGYDVLDGGTPAPNTNPVLIYRQGAGHVDPNKAADPGLVFNSGYYDWLAFICNTQPSGLASLCNSLWSAGYTTKATDFNVASISIGALPGSATVTRTVTNVGSAKATYTASFNGSGISATVSPATFTLNPGQSKKLSITISRTTAALNAMTGGQLTWTDGTHSVRIPVLAKPVALAAPTELSSNGGALDYNVTFGYDGSFSATARGLVPAAVTAGTVADDPTDGACSLTAPNAQLISVVVPSGTTYARFQLFDADVNPGSDIDMCVYRGSTLVGSSGGGTAAEMVNLASPTAATYTVVVQGWGVAGSTPFKLHTWLLDSSDAGNMTVSAPATAVAGGTGGVHVTFSGLAAGTKYLGSVAYSGAAGMPSPTIIRVDNP